MPSAAWGILGVPVIMSTLMPGCADSKSARTLSVSACRPKAGTATDIVIVLLCARRKASGTSTVISASVTKSASSERLLQRIIFLLDEHLPRYFLYDERS